MPTERPVTNESVNVSSYAREVSPAMRPEPRRFSTPMPFVSGPPMMQSSAQRVDLWGVGYGAEGFELGLFFC